MNPREAAYIALSDFEGKPVDETLLTFKKDLADKDLALAREIAAGTTKRILTLQYFAKKLQRRLGLKKKEKRLLFSAIYQYVFMDRIPTYAIVNETTSIAKKYFGEGKARFFNAYLRKLEGLDLSVSAKKNAFDMSLRHSYPPYFIKLMISEYGMKKTAEVLEVQNQTPAPMARLRKKTSFSGLKKVWDDVYRITEKKQLGSLAQNPDIYIQNASPAFLMRSLAKGLEKAPKKILDLCAAPVGKLLMAHDFFPKAELYAHDVSDKKMALLKSNLEKYGVSAHLFQGRAEDFISQETFDLILLDVPCSNTGVLHKRCEARWRLTPDALAALSDLQADILENAAKFLAPGGEIWYMTCSILQEENEDTAILAPDFGLEKKAEYKVLPNNKGWDGGYAISFRSG